MQEPYRACGLDATAKQSAWGMRNRAADVTPFSPKQSSQKHALAKAGVVFPVLRKNSAQTKDSKQAFVGEAGNVRLAFCSFGAEFENAIAVIAAPRYLDVEPVAA